MRKSRLGRCVRRLLAVAAIVGAVAAGATAANAGQSAEDYDWTAPVIQQH